MEQLIALILFVVSLAYLIYRCSTGRPAMPKGGGIEIKPRAVQATEADLRKAAALEGTWPPKRPRGSRARTAGAIGAGAAAGVWASELNGSPFAARRMDDDEIDEGTSVGDLGFFSDLPGGGFVDLVHGGFDPTGQGGMAGDHDPSRISVLEHPDLDSFAMDSFVTDSFADTDTFSSSEMFGSDSTIDDSFSSGISDDF